MAKINNFELKNVKDFLGHEQEPLCQGNIYYKGKKVGFYSQDAHGGCDNIDIDCELSNELKTEIYEILNNYHCDSIFKDNASEKYDFRGGEWLFSELLRLLDDEKNYKKFSKKWGCECIAFIKMDWCTDGITGGHNKALLELNIKAKDEYKNKSYRIYTGLNDFIKEVL